MPDLDELRRSASPDFLAANPEIFGGAKPVLNQYKTDTKTVQNSTWRDFEDEVIKWLRENGWRVVHFRPAKTEKGWRTAVSADGKGFPDILAAKGRCCIALEVKSGSGRASPEQVEWMLALDRAGIKAYLVTPENWEEVKQKILMLKEVVTVE